MTAKPGIIHLIAIIVVLLLIVLGAYFLYTKLTNKKFALPNQAPTVELKKEYKNPFDKNTQYINPFDDYKSPLYSAR